MKKHPAQLSRWQRRQRTRAKSEAKFLLSLRFNKSRDTLREYFRAMHRDAERRGY